MKVESCRMPVKEQSHESRRAAAKKVEERRFSAAIIAV